MLLTKYEITIFFKTLNNLNVLKKVKFQITTVRTYFRCSQPLKNFESFQGFLDTLYMYILCNSLKRL